MTDFTINSVYYPVLNNDSVIIQEMPITKVVKEYDETNALDTITVTNDALKIIINIDHS